MQSGSAKNRRNIKPFNGERYGIWKFRIRALLAEEEVLRVVDDEVPLRPNAEWNKMERTATSIIVENLSDTMLGIVTGEELTAREILQKLDKIYERKSLATQLAVQKKLLSLKFKEDIALMKHFQIFDELMIELLAAGGSQTEMGKVAHLLLTLPSSYDGIVTAIQTLSEESLNLAFVKTRLLDQETKLKSASGETSSKVLHTEYRHPDRTKTTKGKWKQRHNLNFNRPYQTKTWYPNKYGKSWKKTNIKYNAGIKCDHCGRRNHAKKDCYYYKRLQQKDEEADRPRTLQSVQLTEPSFAFMIRSESSNLRSNSSKEITFIIDSGATDHLVNQPGCFTTVTELESPMEISVAKLDASIIATRKGTIDVITDQGIHGVLENVLYAAEVPYNLLSVRRIQEAGMTVIFDATGGLKILKGGKTVIKGRPFNNLLCVEFKLNTCKTSKHASNAEVNSTQINYKLWHERLGHISKQKFLDLTNKEMVDDNSQVKDIIPTNDLCEACVYGKQARLPFSKAKDKSYVRRPLFIIHSDVCGPITPPTLNNKNYFVTFIDEFTHYIVIYLLTYKSEVLKCFQDFVAKSDAHFNTKVVNLYCDNGGEYLSNEFKEFCAAKGITYHLTVPYTPQQNSVAERMNRTITEKARAMIHGAELDKRFWGEAVLTAAYLINISPTKALSVNKTPFELWHGKKPSLKFLKIIGSTVYIHDKTRKNKFDQKSFKGILVGYEPNGYKVYNPDTNKFITVRDVLIDEISFKTSRPPLKLEGEIENNNSNVNINPETATKVVNELDEPVRSGVGKQQTDPIAGKSNKSVTKTDNNADSGSSAINSENKTQGVVFRRSQRLQNLPSVSYKEDEVDMNYYTLCAQSLNCTIPQNYQEIPNRSDRFKWEEAIKEELNSLLINNTWSLVPQPIDKNVVDSKWVFNIKNDIYGNPSKYKARLVARGFSQQYLMDYNETFAPVARIATFRLLLSFANQNNLMIHHMDVKTAFLNGNLTEEIYMRVPEGVKASSNQVCKLHKALYGLKQSARCWFKRFDEVLKRLEFNSSSVDPCLYFLDKGHVHKNIYVILYVDDIVLVTANENTMKGFKAYLSNEFRMVDLQEIKLFLGIQIERNNQEISLNQSAYLKTVLSKFNMDECKAISTPLPTKLDYDALNSDEAYDAPSRNLIGCLMYVMLCTRPDLCVSINLLSRHQSKNSKILWQYLKRVLRYIKGTINIKLVYKQTNYQNILVGFVDSDWGSDETDRKSTTGYIFQLFDCCSISWNTKRQNSVAASSTEAEYMALFEGVREALCLRSLLNDINIKISEPIIMFEDNNGCISLANNPILFKRSKHIDIKYHFIREQVERKVITLQYIPTGEQLADAFTKQLPPGSFHGMCVKMGLKKDMLEQN